MSWTSTTHLNQNLGQLKEALHILLTTHNPPEDYSTYLHLLQTCILKNTLSQGKKLHSFIAHRRFAFATHTAFHNKLIYMYVKCGRLVDARKAFDHMKERDSFSWNTIIAAYRRHGLPHEALSLFQCMQQTGLQPDQFTFASVLPACAKIGALEEGMDIHKSINDRGISSDVVVATALIDMYAKCGSIDNAREMFDKMPQKNVISWNAMIAGYAQNGYVKKALETFKQMQLAGVKPNSTTFASILSACAKIEAFEQGMEIHQSIEDRGILSDVVVATALVDMYAKCRSVDKARELFDRLPQRNVFSWTAIIAGYAQNGFVDKARELFDRMPQRNVVSWSAMIAGYAQNGFVEKARELFDGMPQRDVVSWSAMIAGYAQNGFAEKARELFDRMPQRNVNSWNAMIAGYAQNGFIEKALETFKQMQLAGVKPDPTTFASILPVCAKMGALEQGMDIHQSIKDKGILSDVVVATALVDMYAKCQSIDKARELFDRMPQRNVVSWNAMIAGYAQNGFVEKARELFDRMPKRDAVSWSAMIAGYAQNGFVEEASELFDRTPQRNLVSWNAMIAGYAQNGFVEEASELFDRTPQRNVVSWNAMIAGYAQNGFVEKSVECFKQMQLGGVKPDSTTFASILPACAKMGSLDQGMDIHQSIKDRGIFSDVVETALVDMYAKCGSIDKAREVFDKMPEKNVVSWNALISGYAQNGFVEKALETFKQMQLAGVKPNSTTFASVLCACSHAGLVDEGCTYFNHMSNAYCITPTIDHYVCMVDLIARAGYLEDTLNFIIKMPVKPVVVVWMCFLGACKSYMNLGLGVFTATLLFYLDPKNAATYVLLSNIYAEVGRWDEVQTVRRLMKERGIKKIPGCSWI